MKNIMAVITIISLLLIAGCASNTGFQQSDDTETDAGLITEIDDLDDLLNADREDADEEYTDNVHETIDDDEEITEEDASGNETTEEDEEKIDTSNLKKIKVVETELVNLTVKAQDADGDRIKYAFTEPLDKNGLWQTEHGDEGEYIVTITASDGELETTQTILLVVKKKNVPPTIAGVLSLTANEGDLVKLDLDIRDPNGDDITVKISEPFSGKMTWQTTNEDAGNYTVQVTATDGKLNTTRKIPITILDKNVAPKILTSLPDLTVNEGGMVKLEIETSDADGDEVKVLISGPIGDDGVWTTQHDDNGEYEITVIATDGKDDTIKTFTLEVLDVNKAPEILDISQG